MLLRLDDDGVMLLPELDGFLTGIALSPDPVPTARWMPRVWSGEPPMDDPAQRARAVALVTRHYQDVWLAVQEPGAVSPILDHDERTGETLWETWIAGFDLAMTLAPDGWNRLRRATDPAAVAAFAGFSRLIGHAADPGELSDGDYQALDAEVPAMIPVWADAIAQWRDESDARRTTAKPGRNDPCPCGSGRKHKKCCAA
ncbi:UPF0149 family protein [Sphingomonas ginsenosidimutans]|nr:UPF0149 family protein [Sphingomonas ginsenosidimutans]